MTRSLGQRFYTLLGRLLLIVYHKFNSYSGATADCWCGFVLFSFIEHTDSLSFARSPTGLFGPQLNVTHVFWCPACTCVTLPPKPERDKSRVVSAGSQIKQTHVRSSYVRISRVCAWCLCECYSPKAAIITGVQRTLVCLSLCAPFSCPLRNADYRLDLVTVQQCDDVAQNVRCRRLH